MKNCTLLLLGMFVCSSVATAQQRFVRSNVKSENLQEKYVSPKISKSRIGIKPNFITRSENAILKPQVETIYSYAEGNWDLFITSFLKYDLKGNIVEALEDDGELQEKITTVYNENSKVLNRLSLVSEDGGETWQNSEKKEYEYDEIATDFITKLTTSSWVDENWKIDHSNKLDVTRNGKGFVTRMAIKPYFEGKYEETEYTQTIYENGDLPAQTWKHYMANYNENQELVMSEAVRYDKIKWENSDGQILNHDEGEFVVGNNRIKSADIYDAGVKTATLRVTYTNKRDFESIMSSTTGSDVIKHKLTDTDQNGSYKEQFIKIFDENQDGVMEEYNEYVLVSCDAHKNIVKEEFFVIIDGETEQTDGMKTDYIYGDDGEIHEMITYIWNYEEEKYDPIEKLVASNFIDVTQPTGVAMQTLQAALKCHIEDGKLFFSMNGAAHYAVYNVSGTRVIDENTSNDNESISISYLPDGLYFLVVEGSEGVERVKFIKK